MSVCSALIRQVEGLGKEHKAKAVKRIDISVGVLSGVVAELLEMAFAVAKAGTIAEEAELVCHEMPVRVLCSSCGAETDVTPNRLLCGSCGDWKTHVISGQDLLLKTVEFVTD